ncbi:hypothetical protein KIN20_007645 [Parelaphostrongylus tenuis]|uniref:Uncharacterized protein n=1 Tax=Parelaphostrongylus tenuis TaxID=148309 RepID=A0AAD5M3N5_PARTN|nr:hypothetical protein KIN20_007645 [Parelaphostrongylus tenuis]
MAGDRYCLKSTTSKELNGLDSSDDDDSRLWRGSEFVETSEEANVVRRTKCQDEIVEDVECLLVENISRYESAIDGIPGNDSDRLDPSREGIPSVEFDGVPSHKSDIF